MILDIETLRVIDNYKWLVYIVSLTVLFGIFVKQKYVSSSLVAVLITTIFNWFMDEYLEFMLAVFSDKEFVEHNRTLIRYAWYYGFAAFNAALMFAVYKVHVVLKLSYSYTARYLLFAHFVLSLLQITRVFERQSFSTDYLAPVYQWGVVSINISCAAVTLIFALVAVHRQLNNKDTRGYL